MSHRRGEANAWVSMALMGALGVLIAVYIYRRPQKPPVLPGGQSASTPLPATIDVSSTDASHYLAVLAAYNWYAAARVRPDDLISHQSWAKATTEHRDKFQRRVSQSLSDLPLGSLREWTGVLAPGYALWVAELKSPIGASLPKSWKRTDKNAYGVPVYRVEGSQPLAGYMVVPNDKLVVASTRFDVLENLIASTVNPPLPVRTDLFGSAPCHIVVADLRWLRSPLQGVSLGPPPKTLPPAGTFAVTKVADWVKDFAGGKATATWKDDVLQLEVALAARDSKTAKVIAERLDDVRKRVIKGAKDADAEPAFRASGEEVRYEVGLSPSEVIEAAERIPVER